MRKITALKIEYSYAGTLDSETRLDKFYSWLINKAIDNLLLKQKSVDNNSTLKYTESNEQAGRIPYSRRSRKNPQSKENYYLQNVQNRQATSTKNWKGMEDTSIKVS